MSDIQFPNVLLGPGSVTATVLDNNGAPATVLEAGGAGLSGSVLAGTVMSAL